MRVWKGVTVVHALIRVDDKVVEDERTRKAALRRQNLGYKSKYICCESMYKNDLHDCGKDRQELRDSEMCRNVEFDAQSVEEILLANFMDRHTFC